MVGAAMIVVSLEPPAIIVQVRRRKYYRARAAKPEQWYVVPFDIEFDGKPVFVVKPLVNADKFEERWEELPAPKGDKLR